MKNNKIYKIVAIVLILVSVVFTILNLSIPMAFAMVPAGLLGLLPILALLFIRQHVRDEREELYRYKAGNTAFLLGFVAIVIAFIVKGLVFHELDRFLQMLALGMFIVHLVALESFKDNG